MEINPFLLHVPLHLNYDSVKFPMGIDTFKLSTSFFFLDKKSYHHPNTLKQIFIKVIKYNNQVLALQQIIL